MPPKKQRAPQCKKRSVPPERAAKVTSTAPTRGIGAKATAKAKSAPKRKREPSPPQTAYDESDGDCQEFTFSFGNADSDDDDSDVGGLQWEPSVDEEIITNLGVYRWLVGTSEGEALHSTAEAAGALAITDSVGRSLLHYLAAATGTGDVTSRLKQLLGDLPTSESAKVVNTPAGPLYNHRTPLMDAVIANNVSMAKALLGLGADVNCCTSVGVPDDESPTDAQSEDSESDDDDVPDCTTNNGREVSYTALCTDEATPLIQAVARGFGEMADVLIANGALVDCSSHEVRRKVKAAAAGVSEGGVADLAQRCRPVDTRWFAELDLPTHFHFLRPLQIAAEKQHLAICKALLRQGCEIDCKFAPHLPAATTGDRAATSTSIAGHFIRYGQSPLIASFWHGDILPATSSSSGVSSDESVSITEMLLEHGASPTFSGNWLYPPLHAAAQQGRLNALKLIVKWLAGDKSDNKGGTACDGGAGSSDQHSSAAKFFDTLSPSFPTLGIAGRTPLVLAAMAGHLEICQYFVGLGASKSFACEDMVPHEWAREYGNDDCADFLQKA